MSIAISSNEVWYRVNRMKNQLCFSSYFILYTISLCLPSQVFLCSIMVPLFFSLTSALCLEIT